MLLTFIYVPKMEVKANDDIETYASVPGGGGGEVIISIGTYNYAINVNPNIVNYNCYGYAIGRTNAYINPGYYSNKTITLNGSSLIALDTIEVAVIADLKKLGYTNVKEVTSSYTPKSTETLIAFRVGYHSNLNKYDYHFMRYNQNGYWYHKPGSSAVLKYKYNAKTTTWSSEYYENGNWTIPSFTYNSDIRYIVYTG